MKLSQAIAYLMGPMAATAPSQPGPGVRRAQARHAAKLERLGPPGEGVWTRQRDRAEMRRVRKDMRATRKAYAAARRKGGMAVVS